MDHHTAEHNAEPQQLVLALTYQGLVEILADVEHRPQTTLDLPPLEHSHLAAILQSIPDATFMDALADSPSLRGIITHCLADSTATEAARSQLVGAAVIAALKDYLRPLLLTVVQARWDRNHEVDAIEAPLSHYPALTDEQVVAQELGLGQSLS